MIAKSEYQELIDKIVSVHASFESTVKSPVKPRRPEGRRGLYSPYMTSRTEDVRLLLETYRAERTSVRGAVRFQRQYGGSVGPEYRFYGMNWTLLLCEAASLRSTSAVSERQHPVNEYTKYMCRLFETIQIKDGIVQNIFYHDLRLNNSRRALFGSRKDISIMESVSVPTEYQKGVCKCRLVYSEEGIESVEYATYQLRSIASLRIVHDDEIEYRYKYCDRQALDRLRDLRGTCDDILIIHEGLITDTSFTNIAFDDGRRWLTPAKPLLPGTRRMQLLREARIVEADIGLADLSRFSRASLINAMIDLGELTVDVKNIV